MENVQNVKQNKRLRYGTFSTVTLFAALAIFVLVNLIAEQLNINFDLTEDRIFTLSDDSRVIAQGLESDVTIYALFPTGGGDFQFIHLLEEYAAASSRIRLEFRDPLLHPAFVQNFAAQGEAIPPHSIIVEGPYRHRLIHADDLLTVQPELDPQTFQIINRLVSINIEPQVTNALEFVSRAESPVIYRVTGNNETALAPALAEELALANFELREVNLVTDEVPDDAAILLFTMPERDWTPAQAERIYNFLRNNGRGLFVGGFAMERFARMDETLAAFGAALGDYVIVEGSQAHFFNNPAWLMPRLVPGEITAPLLERQFVFFLPFATGIEPAAVMRAHTIITPLLMTSDDAYGKNDPTAQTIMQEPGDTPGPFNVAAAIEDEVFGAAATTTRLVLIGSESILLPETNDDTSGANWTFLVHSLNWLHGEIRGAIIPPRAPSVSAPLIMSEAEALTIAGVAVILLPVLFIGGGLVVWLRRRNA